MILNPHMLPKVRSNDLRQSIGGLLLGQEGEFPCSFRLAPLLGYPCSPGTVVGAHLPTFGKGASTKVSDLFMGAGCDRCHAIIDQVGADAINFAERYPDVFYDAIMRGHHETLSRWVQMGLISGTDWKLI